MNLKKHNIFINPSNCDESDYDDDSEYNYLNEKSEK